MHFGLNPVSKEIVLLLSELDDSPHPKTNKREIRRRSDLFITLDNGKSSLSSAIEHSKSLLVVITFKGL